MDELIWASARDLAGWVRSGQVSARDATETRLSWIKAVDPRINAFTDITADRALAEADAVDRALTRGDDPGPLAGVPMAAKNLFDIRGLATRAGSKINRTRAPAARDATLITRMNAAGALLLGGLNMGEFAYDFTGENAHDGACCNPHDPACMAGGSSSGSGAATAAGMAPISLGSDTNGSLRVPAALCGTFSLKPTYGRLTRAGSFSFVDSLDHLGPFARKAGDLALAYDAMQGHDPADHGCAPRVAEPSLPGLERRLEGLRIGLPGGWIAKQPGQEARKAAETAAAHLASAGARISRPNLDAAEAGRAAAYLITASESAAFHLDRLRQQPEAFDPDTGDRFRAGALLPAAWVSRAQRVRAWWLEQALQVFRDVDALILPATPVTAPLRGQKELEIDGATVPLRPWLGLMAQPFSCIGLPVVTVPVFAKAALPLGIQIVTRPWAEALGLRIAHGLERDGIATAHPPVLERAMQPA